MEAFDDQAVSELLSWRRLIEGIERILTEPAADAPARTVLEVPTETGATAHFLLKPGWVTGEVIGVKAVTFFPDNGSRGLPTVHAGFLLFDGTDGHLVGACEANALTARRTAAASAVAAKRLARPGASALLVMGTGAVALMAAQAHAAVRDYESVQIWGRDRARAAALVSALAGVGFESRVCVDADEGVARADVISAATGATEPLIRGALLKPGAHVDLIGSFTATMRESDDDVVTRGRLFVDTRRDAVLAGDLAQPLAAGLISADDIEADLSELVSGVHPGRSSSGEITVFKSVGTALEDLAAARLTFGT